MHLFQPWSLFLALLCVILAVNGTKQERGHNIHRGTGDGNLLNVPSNPSSSGRTRKDRYPGHNRCTPQDVGSITAPDTKWNGFCMLHNPNLEYNNGWHGVPCSPGYGCVAFNDPCRSIKKKNRFHFSSTIIDCSNGLDKQMDTKGQELMGNPQMSEDPGTQLPSITLGDSNTNLVD